MVASLPQSAVLHHSAHLLTGSRTDFDPLLASIGQARIVLIGEASHGTHEFYRARTHITRRLIEEKDFTAVVIEGDWPDAYRVNRYVRGFRDDDNAEEALGGFERFPTWMWRNTDVLHFVEWLRAHNAVTGRRAVNVGFYGMDLYSLYRSMASVMQYLNKVDTPAARRARERYACFEQFAEDPQAYGYAAGIDLGRSCEAQVLEQLMELRNHAGDYARRDGRVAQDEYFYAEQNARLVKNAEEYYRTMFHGRVSSWNLRDEHMTDTIGALLEYLTRIQGNTKLVVWAHNSHLGDARATQMSASGELNVGQLVRERFGQDAFLIGFTAHAGTVTAADDWDTLPNRKEVRPSLAGSYERLFHDTQIPQFLLILRDDPPLISLLNKSLLERAIGVIYRPETERESHYFKARLAQQFDAVIHFDHSRAVEPLELHPAWHHAEVPEAFPTGL